MRAQILSRQSLTAALLLGGSLLASGCSVVGALTPQEQAIQQQVDVTQYMPATREMRDNIETQELFAQAAFWSNEYELNPADLEATIKLAAAVRKLGNPARSVEITQTSRQLHPRDPYLLAEHAAGLIASERALDAIPILDQGLRFAPQYGRLWSLKGAALDQMEDYQAARQHYARALQITPNDPNVLANLGLSHALSGDPRTAEVWLRRAAAQPGAGAGVRQNLALVLELQGKTEAAEQQARLSQLSRGDRKLPPEPVPAFTPRGVPAEMAETTTYSAPVMRDLRPQSPQMASSQYRQPQHGQQMSAPYGDTRQASAPLSAAPPMRGSAPQARLTSMDASGQSFTNSREAARGQVNYQAGAPSQPSPQPAPLPTTGEMTPEQAAVLNSIRQSLQPGASAPQPPAQQAGAEQPYLVGPAPTNYVQSSYGQAQQQPSYQAPAQSYTAPTRRDPARRRR